jgi:hypothetical protein
VTERVDGSSPVTAASAPLELPLKCTAWPECPLEIQVVDVNDKSYPLAPESPAIDPEPSSKDQWAMGAGSAA